MALRRHLPRCYCTAYMRVHALQSATYGWNTVRLFYQQTGQCIRKDPVGCKMNIFSCRVQRFSLSSLRHFSNVNVIFYKDMYRPKQQGRLKRVLI